MVQYSFITRKKTELSLQYGYSKWKGNSSQAYRNEANGGRSEYDYSQRSNIQSLRLGIGKRSTFQKFLLSSLVYLRVQLEYQTKWNDQSNSFDNTNTLTSSSTRIIKYPNTLHTGIYLAQSIYYPVMKSLYVGAEANIGIQWMYRNGSRTDKDVSYNYLNSLTNTSEVQMKDKMSYASLDFLPALSVKYQFGGGKKK